MMGMEGRRVRKPVDGLQVRLKNRRLQGYLLPDGSIHFVFKRLVDGDIVKQAIRLSQEAVAEMFFMKNELMTRHPELDKEKSRDEANDD